MDQSRMDQRTGRAITIKNALIDQESRYLVDFSVPWEVSWQALDSFGVLFLVFGYDWLPFFCFFAASPD